MLNDRDLGRVRVSSSSAFTSPLFGVGVLFVFTVIAAFIRHLWWTLSIFMSDVPLTAGKALLAVGGIFLPPLGALHGVWLWFH